MRYNMDTKVTIATMLNIGHRGASGYEPENTLRSFRRAIELGVDMVELDVYVCKSGELVVMHDNTVDRTTNGKGYVSDMTLDDLKSLDAGKGESIPTLREVFDQIDKKVEINIELKGEKTAVSVAELINEYVKTHDWSFEMFLVSSFNHYELRLFQQHCPEVRVGALLSGIPIGYADFALPLRPYSINLDCDFCTKEFVDDAHSKGMKVLVWTVNDVEVATRMRKIGADGVFTNFPDLLQQAGS